MLVFHFLVEQLQFCVLASISSSVWLERRYKSFAPKIISNNPSKIYEKDIELRLVLAHHSVTTHRIRPNDSENQP